MGLVKFDPMRSFDTLSRRMGNFLSDFDNGVNFEFGGFSPRVDISEDEKNLYLEAELPGIKKEEVKVTVNNDNMLIIKGEKKRENEVKDDNDRATFMRVERSFGEFMRSFVLPDNVKNDSVKARFENGVLKVTVEKVEPEKPKEISVDIS